MVKVCDLESLLKDLMAKLTGFRSGKTGCVMFSADQVCDTLGVSVSRSELEDIVPAEWRELWPYSRNDIDEDVRSLLWPEGDTADKMMISESGVYSLMMVSDSAQGNLFLDWVTHSLLPSIREDGLYVLGSDRLEPEDRQAMIGTLNHSLGRTRTADQ